MMLSRLQMLSIPGLTVLLFTLPSSAWAKVARAELLDLIKHSAYIVSARVESVEMVDGVRIARAVPQQEFKGSTGRKPFYFVAEATWTCDSSTAVKGENVLLFLNPLKGNRVEREMMSKPSAHVRVPPLFSIAHSGYGRLQLRSVNTQAYVTVNTYSVLLPKGLKTIPGPDAQYPLIIRSVLLSDLAKLIPRPKATPTRRSVPTFTMSQ